MSMVDKLKNFRVRWFTDNQNVARILLVDRFASFHNCQVPRFNSRCWNPGSEAVDAFTVNSSDENN